MVVPLMYSELVEVNQYMTNQEFLTGFGLVQGLPGPMFSFSAYAGGMAARGQSTLYQILGAAAGGIITTGLDKTGAVNDGAIFAELAFD